MKDREVVVSLRHGGKNRDFRGTREGKYVRLSMSAIERHPAIQAVVQKGEKLNNVWAIIETESGQLLQKGHQLYGRVRVGKRTGGYLIAATVTLGVVIAIKSVQRTHNER